MTPFKHPWPSFQAFVLAVVCAVVFSSLHATTTTQAIFQSQSDFRILVLTTFGSFQSSDDFVTFSDKALNDYLSFQTDVCGIKWIVYREDESSLTGQDHPNFSEDPVLSSFSRCLDSELLAVWRRVPKKDLVTFSYDMDQMTQQQQQQNRAQAEEKNLLKQRKELWVFWYGDKPQEQFNRLIASKLKEVKEISGTWENGLPYEARTLLFKALNNLIERSLVSKDFVRIGKWFVQTFDGPDSGTNSNASGSEPKSTHLSFSFQYFIHGESTVCASLDVRQHPPVRKVSLHHLSLAKAQASPVQVILAPYGLSGTLTGVTFKKEERNVERLLRDWNSLFRLSKNRYFCQNPHGDIVQMPAAVEVMVAGVRMVYPTSYVLVSDMDITPEMAAFASAGSTGFPKTMQTCTTLPGNPAAPCYRVEPSPFTTYSHPLLVHDVVESGPLSLAPRAEHVWQDGVCINPEQSAHPVEPTGQTNNSQILEYLGHWDFNNPSRILKKKARNNRQNSKERSRDSRNRFSTKIPHHKKADIVEELAWTMDHTDMLCGNGQAGAGARLRGGTPAASVGPASMGPPGSVRGAGNEGSGAGGLTSPASIGTPVSVLTPKAPGDPHAMMSPQVQPASNGPLTPMESDNKPPRTPKSVPPPSYSIASPYTSVKSVEKKSDVVKQEESEQPEAHTGAQQPQQPNSGIKQEMQTQSESTPSTFEYGSSLNQQPPAVTVQAPVKRPSLPLKEYELELLKEDSLSDVIYDYQAMQDWLNHPVKKFRPSDPRNSDPKRPMYRRQSQANLFHTEVETTSIKKDPDGLPANGHVDQSTVKRESRQPNGVAVNGDPYAFNDGNGVRGCNLM